MMSLRPIVVNSEGMILGGNMRYQALIALGYKEIPDNWVKVADQLNAEEERRFVIEDNVGFGDWDYDMLANDWDSAELEAWGVDVWQNKDDKEKAKPSTARQWTIKIEFSAEADCAEWFDKLTSMGLRCKISGN